MCFICAHVHQKLIPETRLLPPFLIVYEVTYDDLLPSQAYLQDDYDDDDFGGDAHDGSGFEYVYQYPRPQPLGLEVKSSP